MLRDLLKVVTLTISISAFTQNEQLDSLNQLLNNDIHDSLRAEVMSDVVWLIKFSEPQKAIEMGKESLSLAREIGNERIEAYASNNLAMAYWGKSTYDSAIILLSSAKDYYEKVGNERGKAVSLINIALLYQNIPDYAKSIENALSALEYFEKELDSLGMASVLLNIGNVYFYMEEYGSALKYYSNSWNLRKHINKSGFGENRQRILLNLGNTYYKLQSLDSSIYYLKKSQTFARTVPDYKNLALSNLDLGKAYHELGQLDESLKYLKEGEKIYEQKQFESVFDEAGLRVEMARTLIDLKQYQEAKKNIQKSVSLAQQINNKVLLKDALEIKSQLHFILNEGSLAYENLLESVQINDSLLTAQKSKQINELQTQYETEKKEQQIALQKAEIAEQEAEINQKKILLFASLSGIILLIIVGVLLRSRLQKKQQIKLQEAQLRTKEAEINATITSQEKERARYARDLHDGFGQMISILNMNLKNLEGNPKPDDRQKVFEESSKVIDDMYGELKNICFDLMPQTLIKNGLESALKEFAERINQTGKIFIELNVFGLDKRLSEIQEISLYRISQEWVNNILKYSDANRVTLQITKDEEEITLLIEDDGSGFDKAMLNSGKGNGWKNLNTRSKLISGQLELETSPSQKGNVLIINAPTTITQAHKESLQNTLQMV